MGLGLKSPTLFFGDNMPEDCIMHSAIAAVKPDFSGWATKSNVLCEDGLTILPDAFAHQDKEKVPLVWQHCHDDPDNVLGHAILESRDGDVYAYGYFNKTPKAKTAKELIEHGDIDALSIFANKLKKAAQKVSHGKIRELSLVMGGANEGAKIDFIQLQHSDPSIGTVVLDDEAVITFGEHLKHGDDTTDEPVEFEIGDESEEFQHAYDSMDDKQKDAVHYFVGAAIVKTQEGTPSKSGEKPDLATLSHSGTNPDKSKENPRVMSRNAFEEQNKPADGRVPTHQRVYVSPEDLKQLMHDAMRPGNTLKGVVQDYALEHGIDNIDLLFPDARAIAERPEFDQRRIEWVKGVMAACRKSPFSRIKNLVADITHDEARARGYIKGNFKKEEFFKLQGRKTTPTTVYKKQKLDRNDIVDIIDFDVVAWMKAEMRVMLEEEIARAILIGDGRALDDEDKIDDPQGATEGEGIRSIANDHELYAHPVNIRVDDANFNASDIIDQVLLAMGQYKGTGQPTLYTTLPIVTKMLLAKDTLGRRLYRTRADLASEMGVANIVDVEVMQAEPTLLGVIVNLVDYTLGADRGGDVSMFDDFDIDYNQFKYLIETRLSGALTKIRSALVLRKVPINTTVRVPEAPTFNPATGEVTVPNQTGVSYRRADTDAVVTNTVIPLAEYQELTIYAVGTAGNMIDNTANSSWTFRNGREYTGRDVDQGTPPGSV